MFDCPLLSFPACQEDRVLTLLTADWLVPRDSDKATSRVGMSQRESLFCCSITPIVSAFLLSCREDERRACLR